MRDSELARLSRRWIANQRTNQERLLAYLREHPCVDRGDPDIVVLELDHLGSKRYNVSSLVNSGATWPAVALEIAKCQVRCANCHRKRTARQSGSYRLAATK